MDQVDGHRPFANSRGNSLHRGSAYITRDKDARQASLKRQWLPLECPARGSSITHQLGTGNDETAVVTGDRLSEPVGMRVRADEDKQEVRRHLLLGSCRAVAD